MNPKDPLVLSEEKLIQKALKASMDYPAYKALVAEQAEKGETSGPQQTEALAHYTLLNNQRMARWDKKFVLPEAAIRSLQELKHKLIWLVLTETWCGDAAPVLPVMEAFARNSPNISLRIALRDEHPELMDLHLSRGTRSIPKLLMLKPHTFEVVGSWGPRPSEATRMADQYRELHGKLSPDFKKSLQQWYNKDKGANITADLQALLALE